MLPERLDEPPFQRRMQENLEAKRVIAARVCDLVRDGDSLILDGGTTCVHIAQALCARSRLTVVTNSAEIARTLAPRNGNRVFIAGGEVRADDAAAFGESTLAFIRQFHVRYAIVSVTAIDAQGRFMDAQPDDVSYSLAAFAQAERRVVVADHAKFGHSALVHAFGLRRGRSVDHRRGAVTGARAGVRRRGTRGEFRLAVRHREERPLCGSETLKARAIRDEIAQVVTAALSECVGREPADKGTIGLKAAMAGTPYA